MAEDLFERSNGHVVSYVGNYKDQLERIISRTQARVITVLNKDLKQDVRGVVQMTAGNAAALKRLDKQFMATADEMGLEALNTAFVKAFPTALEGLPTTLKEISDTLKSALPKITFSAADGKELVAQQMNAKAALRTAVEQAAIAVKQRALLQVGGIPFHDLADLMAKKFHQSIGQAEGLAATALSTYWRTLHAAAYEKVEEGLPEGTQLLYKYVGPKDKLTRAFCRSQVGKIRSREEWEAMDNGQSISNPFLYGGGHRCRHQLVTIGMSVKKG